MKKKGVLAVVSGFSGAGKGTLMKALLQAHPDQYALSISATTRLPRAGEEHGREYFFVSREEFEGMIREGALIEHACYVGNYYGTPRDYVSEQMESGKDVILEIEIQGALKVKERFPDALLLFVTPPSAAELENRLRAQIIDSYGEVTVSAAEEDPTVCLVEFSFAVAHGLNQIVLTAHITI